MEREWEERMEVKDNMAGFELMIFSVLPPGELGPNWMN